MTLFWRSARFLHVPKPTNSLDFSLTMHPLTEQILNGNKRALSRAISLLERDDVLAAQIMAQVHPQTGNGYTVGITGPPGAGKSTLIARLTQEYRSQGRSVGILAVDPSSPYSGGALLGDRIRMESHYLDAGVFIRSMSTRGAHGGVPRIVKGVARLLEASGKDVALVETVGVGQTELDVMGVADTVVVTLVPEAGDAVQTLKAGLMEIADVFVVNKADRPGAKQMTANIRSLLSLSATGEGWTPPVVETQAVNGVGIDGLVDAIEEHRKYLTESGELEERRRKRRSSELTETLRDRLARRVEGRIAASPALRALVERVEAGELEPYSASLELLEDIIDSTS